MALPPIPYHYPTPTASPFDDIEQYIGLLLGAVDDSLDRPDVWDASESSIAMGYMEDLKAFIQELDTLTPVGTVIAFAGNDLPSGWLWCDGTAVERSEYNKLFSAIGIAFGEGDGSTTFNLPGMAGRAPIGAGLSDLGPTYDRGAKGGEYQHELTINELPAHSHVSPAHSHTTNPHTHTQAAHSHTVSGKLTTGNSPNGAQTGVNPVATSTDLTTTAVAPTINNANVVVNAATVTINNTGGGLSHNNMSPYVVMNYIIRYR